MAVRKAAEEGLKGTGHPGFVNIPLSPPMPLAQGRVIGTVTGFATLDDVDAFIDRLLADEARLAAREKINAMCDQDNVSISRIMNPPRTPPEGFVPKIIQRNNLEAKPGKAPELLEVLLEWREELPHRGATIVSVPLGGQLGAVRVTQIVESLQALEDLRGQIAASPRAPKLLDLVNPSGGRGVGRITYNNLP